MKWVAKSPWRVSPAFNLLWATRKTRENWNILILILKMPNYIFKTAVSFHRIIFNINKCHPGEFKCHYSVSVVFCRIFCSYYWFLNTRKTLTSEKTFDFSEHIKTERTRFRDFIEQITQCSYGQVDFEGRCIALMENTFTMAASNEFLCPVSFKAQNITHERTTCTLWKPATNWIAECK